MTHDANEHADGGEPATSAVPDGGEPANHGMPVRAGESSAVRADAAIRAIASGSDPAEEAFALANRFTDDATARFRARVRSLLRRRQE